MYATRPKEINYLITHSAIQEKVFMHKQLNQMPR